MAETQQLLTAREAVEQIALLRVTPANAEHVARRAVELATLAVNTDGIDHKLWPKGDVTFAEAAERIRDQVVDLQAEHEVMCGLPLKAAEWSLDVSVLDLLAVVGTFLEPVDGGWIVWTGGPCPLAPDDMVSVRLRGGAVIMGTAGGFTWEHAKRPAGAARGLDQDIVEYRKEPKKS